MDGRFVSHHFGHDGFIFRLALHFDLLLFYLYQTLNEKLPDIWSVVGSFTECCQFLKCLFFQTLMKGISYLY